MFDFVFWVLAVITVGSALGVLFTRNLFRAALLLALCFFMVAGLYVTLHADFLAAVQVLIYIGAITVLIILGIMLTREIQQGNFPNRLGFWAFLTSLIVLVILVFAVTSTSWKLSGTPPTEPTTGPIGAQLFADGGYLLPVEIASLMLLAAVVGAVVLLREK